jgi:branched-chain amino acid transport system permease protein
LYRAAVQASLLIDRVMAMSVGLFIQLLVNALTIGSVYVLMVLGLDIILRGTKILNFAHGQLYMLGAYVLFLFFQLLHWNFILSLLLVGAILAIVGAVSYLGIFAILQKRFTVNTTFSYRLLLSAMASVGLMMILQQGALLGFGTQERGILSPLPQVLEIWEVRISVTRIAIIVLSVLVCVLLYLLMYKTTLGKILRAVSYDPEAVTLQGINTQWIFVLCFALGSSLAGLAGGIIAPLFSVTPDMGQNVIFMAFLVLLVGGIGSYRGTVAGGLLVGLLLSFGFQLFGGVAQLFVFMLAIVILVFRPGGILGETAD